MTIAGSLDGHHGPGILGTRSRHVKPLAIAGLVLTLIVLIRASPLFHPRVSLFLCLSSHNGPCAVY